MTTSLLLLVQNQFITFVSMLLSLLVITTGFVQFISNDVENDEGEWGIGVHNMQFHDALYFSIITFGLVGYGDIHPTQTIGRLSMTLLITVAFISIPMQMGVLVRKFRMRPGYSGVMNVASKESHIIVACDVACTGIPDFLAEFFHEDHGFQNAKICLLVPGEPNMYMQALILRCVVRLCDCVAVAVAVRVFVCVCVCGRPGYQAHALLRVAVSTVFTQVSASHILTGRRHVC